VQVSHPHVVHSLIAALPCMISFFPKS
jgi:hypothetical protein